VEFTLLGAALASAAAVFATLRLQRPPAPGHWDTMLAAAMAGLLAGRLAAMALAGVNPLARPADVLIVRSGVDTGWASLAAIVTVAVLGRRDPLRAMDAAAPAALAGLAAWHGSCALRGTCLGTASDLPWAITASGGVVTRHPVEIYAALLLVFGAVVAARWGARSPRPGRLGGAAVMLAAAVRLVTEPMRPVLGTGPVGWYAAGLAAGGLLWAAAWWLEPAWRSPRGDQGVEAGPDLGLGE
jgi:prolipoprotein diacylglyceryltransferase